MEYFKKIQKITNAKPQTLTPENGENKGSVHVFTTTQSIVTFPIASSAIMVMWKVLGKVFPTWGASHYTLFGIGLLAGFLIYLIGINAQMSRKDKIIAFGIALINSFFLMASALGILQTIDI